MPSRILPWAVPVLGLLLLALMGTMYSIDQQLYQRILTWWGIIPFRYPFLDWEYIGAGADCWKRGVNVYIENPCDVLLRPHTYSPLWLRASFIPTGRVWTSITGAGLDVGFFLALFVLLKPVNWREVLVFAFAATSTMIVFALERGNVDVILFLMVLLAAVLATGPMPNRIRSYGLLVFAGLLKFYPLIALVTALRERPRVFAGVALVTTGIVLVFVHHYRDELVAMARNIPAGGFDGDLFGASNLPAGITAAVHEVAPQFRQSRAFAALHIVFVVLLLIATGLHAFLLSRNAAFDRAFSRLAERDRIFITLGSALIAGCFFVGQSIGYRGIHLLFFIAGLTALRRTADNEAMRTTLTWLAIIVVFLMWEGLFRHALGPHGILPQGVDWPLKLFLLVRELLWWYLVSVMLAVLAAFSLHATAVEEARRWWFQPRADRDPRPDRSG